MVASLWCTDLDHHLDKVEMRSTEIYICSHLINTIRESCGLGINNPHHTSICDVIVCHGICNNLLHL